MRRLGLSESNPNKQKFFAIGLILIAFLLVLGLLCVPMIKGKYRFNKFTESIHLQMNREQIINIADEIGYNRVDVEVLGKGIVSTVENVSLDKICDVYYFNNFLLHSVVTLRYDHRGKVVEIVKN